MSKSEAPTLDAVMEQAVAEQKAGRLGEAERLYRAVLRQRRDHPIANHNLGVVSAQRGEAQRSLFFFKAALEAEPQQSLFWLSYARGLLASGHAEDALRLLDQGRQRGLSGGEFDALVWQARARLRPGALDVDGVYAGAVQLHKAGRPAEAVALYRKVILAQPNRLDVYDNLAAALGALGRFDEAVAVYRKALAQSPDNAELLDGLGYALTAQGAFEEAAAAYRQAIALKPDFAEAHFHLGSVLSENGAVAEGFAHFMRRAELVHGAGAPRAGPTKPEPPHKVKHDREQRDFLAGGRASDDAPAVADTFHLADGERLAGPAVNPANATPALLEQWRRNAPQMVVIDDFLTPQALDRLRAYCAGSTIWRRIYDAGYIGATPEDGFACSLMAQIAEEIRSTYPDILGPHRFRYLGAFKYDSELSTGTNTHADNAAVNVNFYIAPDHANLDPESGGMEVWDVSAPDEAAMRRYNGDEAAVREFLGGSGARSTIVPHRANRAVIFRSDLFHKTDRCEFKEGYLNKRINVSLLFGDLGAPT